MVQSERRQVWDDFMSGRIKSLEASERAGPPAAMMMLVTPAPVGGRDSVRAAGSIRREPLARQ